MNQPIRPIPVEHDPAIYAIETSSITPPTPLSLTLLELIQAVSEVSDSEQELIASVVYMLRSGRIRLAGSFRDCGLDEFND